VTDKGITLTPTKAKSLTYPLDLVINYTRLDGSSITFLYTLTAPSAVNEKDLSESSLQIYPNPTHGTFTLMMENVSETQKANIEITDITGKVIWKTQTVGNIVEKVNLSSQAKGIYFVKYQNETVNFTKKLMVE